MAPHAHEPDDSKTWAEKLLRRSILKQNKLENILRELGDVRGLRCLDLGADNGVISLFLRRCGGTWASADLADAAVASIRALVESDVHRLDGGRTPFRDGEFDRIVIVDFLEHLADDAGFIRELRRILKDDGRLVINCPHHKRSLLRRLRLRLGQTDEKHGHLRPGYTPESLAQLCKGSFAPVSARTYSRFFTEGLDTLITAAVGVLRRHDPADAGPSKGVLLTGGDLQRFRKALRLYALAYPLFWLMTRLDSLLLFRPGYCLISRWKPLPRNGR